MSLLDSEMTQCIIMDKKTLPDGLGGVVTEWKEGALIDAAITLDTSMEARIGAAQGVKNLYTVVTKKSVVLRKPDVIKRKADGKTFRITSDGDDKKTPNSSKLNMRVVTAEEWVIPK